MVGRHTSQDLPRAYHCVYLARAQELGTIEGHVHMSRARLAATYRWNIPTACVAVAWENTCREGLRHIVAGKCKVKMMLVPYTPA